MKYVCLRNCFVNVQLWKKDKVYDLPDSMEKDPKNFRRVGMTDEQVEEELNAEHEKKLKMEAGAANAKVKKEAGEAKAAKAAETPSRLYFCTKTQCLKNHVRTGRLGKLHQKYERKED